MIVVRWLAPCCIVGLFGWGACSSPSPKVSKQSARSSAPSAPQTGKVPKQTARSSAPSAPQTGGETSRRGAPQPAASGSIAGSSQGGDVLLRTEADLDGRPGAERIELLRDGTLRAGAAEARVELPNVASTDDTDDTEAWRFWLREQGQLQVVTFRASPLVKAVLVGLPVIERGEDPPNVYHLFLWKDEGLQHVLTLRRGSYGPLELRFPGDGTLRYVEDGWSACQRAGHAYEEQSVARQEVVFRLDPRTGRMREAERRATSSRQRCDLLAACPAVYVALGAGRLFVGEILRNLRGPSAYAEQSLVLPPVRGDSLRLILAEEKPEVTHLDAVRLEADGVSVPPSACSRRGEGAPDYCVADGRFHALRSGDALTLEFPVPRGARRLVLRAWGYYVPVPSSSGTKGVRPDRADVVQAASGSRGNEPMRGACNSRSSASIVSSSARETMPSSSRARM